MVPAYTPLRYPFLIIALMHGLISPVLFTADVVTADWPIAAAATADGLMADAAGSVEEASVVDAVSAATAAGDKLYPYKNDIKKDGPGKVLRAVPLFIIFHTSP